MNIEIVKQLNIPKAPGSYQYYNKKGEVIYVGKAVDLRSRVLSYFRKSTNHTPAKKQMIKQIAKIKWIETETEIEALLLEANLIKKWQPYFNVDLRDDKRFTYIKISTEDEIPGVFVTRKLDKQGKYFGPFTSAIAVRETLKAIRKIWPFCTERKLKKKICFYAQIGRCTGVCGGKQELKEYKEKIIKPIEQFLSGEKKKIVKNLEDRILNLELRVEQIMNNEKRVTINEKRITKDKNNLSGQSLPLRRGRTGGGYDVNKQEELEFLRYQLLNMKKVLDHTRVISIGEKYTADVVELAKILGLPRVPERIEGYDISNIFGQEAVGSMVVFSGGESDKSEYRKFKIKIGEGSANDAGMLREVLTRRFERITSNEKRITKDGDNVSGQSLPLRRGRTGGGYADWPKPDLIIIDGGKAQLNVGVRLLKKYNLDTPIISISKGRGLRSAQAPDKVFFPGVAKPLELPLASPALHIIKRVRDEAHRFAIKYHRELRKKSWMK